jgi:hypothetical protein
LSMPPFPDGFSRPRILLWRCLSMWPPPSAPERRP